MATANTTTKNPRRVAAGRRSRLLRGPLTDDGRRRLSEAAKRNKPWLFSTGPRTAEGKARVAAAARRLHQRNRGAGKLQAVVADVTDITALRRQMADVRCQLRPGDGVDA